MTTAAELADKWSIEEGAILAYCSNHLVTPDEIATDYDHFFDSYCGQYASMEDYAQDLVDSLVTPNWVTDNNYVAYDRIANDLLCEGYWMTDDGHVFCPA